MQNRILFLCTAYFTQLNLFKNKPIKKSNITKKKKIESSIQNKNFNSLNGKSEMLK